MVIDTATYELIEKKVQQAIRYVEGIAYIGSIKNQFMQKLLGLSFYCGYRIQAVQEAERVLQQKQEQMTVSSFTHHFNHYVIKPGSGSVKDAGFFKMGAGAAYRFNTFQTVISKSVSIIKTTLETNILSGVLKAEVQASLFDEEGAIAPQLIGYVGLQAYLAQASLALQSDIPFVKASTKLTGSIGTVYAQAEAVLSKAEQTLSLKAGAAALTGEAQCAFELFGAKVTLTGSLSLGSAEAELTYSHKNKEWEFGSKLGFIAGLGFRIKVEY